jgi:hypothetical protein
MIPVGTRSIAVVSFVLLALTIGACGGDAVQSAGTHWIIPEDVESWPDALSGEDSSPEDAGAELSTGDCQAPLCPPTDTILAPPDVPPECTAGERLCDGIDVLECREDGDGWDYVEACDDDDPCTDDLCVAGECLFEETGSCCDPPCPMGQLCFDGECVCAAQCFGKECGDDGCGGACGECPDQHHCSPAGLCLCDPACTFPNGDSLECGDDGCGDVCGFCIGVQDACVDGLCICQPDCEGKECGTDGCGGDCGTCPAQHECTAEAACVCVPDCSGKSCGGDGCGGSCGECNGPLYICGGSLCVQDPAFAPVLGPCTPHLHGGAVYYVCWEPVKWDDAKDYCENNGTWLATITTDGEQAFLTGLAGAAGQPLWIGLKQGIWEWDPFEWITGEGKPVTHWGDGEPNNGGFFESEDCGEMTPSGAWNDEQCGAENWFFCEFSS